MQDIRVSLPFSLSLSLSLSLSSTFTPPSNDRSIWRSGIRFEKFLYEVREFCADANLGEEIVKART